jgi:hypothetical protein
VSYGLQEDDDGDVTILEATWNENALHVTANRTVRPTKIDLDNILRGCGVQDFPILCMIMLFVIWSCFVCVERKLRICLSDFFFDVDDSLMFRFLLLLAAPLLSCFAVHSQCTSRCKPKH